MILRRWVCTSIQAAMILLCNPLGIAQEPTSSNSVTAQFWSTPNTPVTVLEDTPIHVMTVAPINAREARENEDLLFTLSEDVIVDGYLIIPRGATIHGTVVQSQTSGRLSGSPTLTLKLTSLELEGRIYPLYSHHFRVTGAGKGKQTMTNVLGGTAVGGLIGDSVRRNTVGETTSSRKLAYVAKGAAIGAAAGTAAAATSPGPVLLIPAESQIDFSLAAPISVIPVTAQEAERLRTSISPGGPVLYVRGVTP